MMAAELLGELAPSVSNEAALAMAQDAVRVIAENKLDSQPTLIVPLNLARGGDSIAIMPSKVRESVILPARVLCHHPSIVSPRTFPQSGSRSKNPRSSRVLDAPRRCHQPPCPLFPPPQAPASVASEASVLDERAKHVEPSVLGKAFECPSAKRHTTLGVWLPWRMRSTCVLQVTGACRRYNTWGAQRGRAAL